MIIRVEHRARYTVITNQALRDDRLSFRATGVLAYILSFHDEVPIAGRRLTVAKKEGRDAVLAALGELEKAGYLRRDREQGPDGKWRTICVVHEIQPSPENPDPVPGNRAITSQQPSPGKPGAGFPGHKDLSTEDEVLESAPQTEIPHAEDALERIRATNLAREGCAIHGPIERPWENIKPPPRKATP